MCCFRIWSLSKIFLGHTPSSSICENATRNFCVRWLSRDRNGITRQRTATNYGGSSCDPAVDHVLTADYGGLSEKSFPHRSNRIDIHITRRHADGGCIRSRACRSSGSASSSVPSGSASSGVPSGSTSSGCAHPECSTGCAYAQRADGTSGRWRWLPWWWRSPWWWRWSWTDVPASAAWTDVPTSAAWTDSPRPDTAWPDSSRSDSPRSDTAWPDPSRSDSPWSDTAWPDPSWSDQARSRSHTSRSDSAWSDTSRSDQARSRSDASWSRQAWPNQAASAWSAAARSQ
jgi:hypothetical protein